MTNVAATYLVGAGVGAAVAMLIRESISLWYGSREAKRLGIADRDLWIAKMMDTVRVDYVGGPADKKSRELPMEFATKTMDVPVIQHSVPSAWSSGEIHLNRPEITTVQYERSHIVYKLRPTKSGVMRP